jgi:hypothetical protein
MIYRQAEEEDQTGYRNCRDQGLYAEEREEHKGQIRRQYGHAAK